MPVLTETIEILNESAIYLLFGFLLAGVMHVAFSRSRRLSNLLAGDAGRSVTLAAFLGLPLPLCSCGVLPAGLALHRKGASKGATASFLISVPETDIVSIVLTYGLLGPVMAVVRPLAALVTAIVTGHVVDWVDRRPAKGDAKVDSCEAGCGSDGEYDAKKSAGWNALHFGFVRFFDDIMPSLLFGILVGGLVSAVLPELGIEQMGGHGIWPMLAMLAIGIPMYVCATASTPIAVGLIAGGISPGAALVFLLAGPATNIASLVVLGRHFGRRALSGYLISVAGVSLLMGLGLEAVMSSDALRLPAIVPAEHHTTSPLMIGGSVLLLILTAASFYRTRVLSKLAARFVRILGLAPSTSADDHDAGYHVDTAASSRPPRGRQREP